MSCEAEAVTLSAALLVFIEGSLAAKSLVHRFASDGTLLEERVSLLWAGDAQWAGGNGGALIPLMLGLQVAKWLHQATGTRESVGSEQSESEVQYLSAATAEFLRCSRHTMSKR